MFYLKTEKKSKGFTLIEMLVAVSIFVLVAFVVVTVFISALDAYRKAQNMKRIMENLNFALNSMALNIREGYQYSVTGGSTSNTGNTLSVCSKADCSQANIYKIESDTKGDRTVGRLKSNTQFMTSREVDITNLYFEVIGAINEPQMVKVFVKGKAQQGDKEKEKAEFAIQAHLSKRNVKRP